MSGLVESSADARSKTIGQNFRCRAWVNFNGSGTVAIRASGNVSSVTDRGGSGDYTVNFTTAMPDADFSTVASSQGSGGTDNGAFTAVYSYSTSGVAVRPRTATSSGAFDSEIINVAVFR